MIQEKRKHKKSKKKPSAMAQVHNRVNAGVMDGVVYGGMMEESQERFETWYRGYKAKYGSDHDHLLWLTDDIDYARSYGNRVEEVVLDMDKVNPVSLYDLDDYGYDYIDGPDEEGCRELVADGYNCYFFEANEDCSYCICLWDKSAIVSRRELSREEFDSIEGYEGYDNPGYDVDLNEAAEPEDEEYEIGMEEDGLEPYGHVVEGRKTIYISESQLMGLKKILCESASEREKKFLKIYAVNTYGTTDNFDSAGFILTTGELLNFGNYNEIYRKSHGALDLKGKNFRDFINAGNIRVNPQSPGIEFCDEPTDEQYKEIHKMIKHYLDRGVFYVDCIDSNGKNIWNKEYHGEETNKVVDDIKLFFKNGARPEAKGNDVLMGYSLSDFLEESKVAKHNIDVDYNKYIKSLIDFMREQHLKIDPLPKIELNPEEQDGIFVKTGYYSPDEKKVVVFTDGRHPKDVLRTVAHEFIHHMQNLQNPDKDWGGGGDLEEDSKLRSIEGEAFLLGNIIFREWTEKMKRTKELNESVIKESPDRLYSLGVNWLAGDAVPFMFYKVDNKFHVGEEGQAHIDMMSELGLDDDSLNDICDDEGFGMYVDLKRTGRYWPSVNAISFWDTPLFQKEILIDTVNRLSSYIDIDFRNLLVDWWEGPADSLIPYRWFVNGTFEMLSEYGVVKVIRGKNNVFDVFTRSGKQFRVDTNGDFVENEYAYSYFNESINIKKALVDQKKRRDPDDIERLDEIEAEIIEPDDVDLSSFNIKKHLNPKFWDNGHLDTRIRIKLLDIADDFFDSLGVDWVEPEDVIITGSLANYNWNKKYSDIDLHVLVDYEDVDERVDFVRDFFTLKKNEWNQKHKNLRIFGFPVEVYVQDSNEPHASSGVYSVDKDEWLTEPDIDKLRSGKVNKRHIREMVSTYMNKIDCLIDIYKKHKDDEYEMKKVAKDATEMFDEIKKLRKDDLGKYGREMCDGNIIFKALRRSDYIGKLIKLKDLTYDKINSL